MNKEMKPTPPQQQKSDSIRDRVFSTIDEQKVEPTPCYVFWCQNSAMWMIWLLTVLLGALATAVLIFTSTYRYYDIYEAMHDNFLTFFFQALPVLWIFAFIILMGVAMRGLRATRRGYRLSPSFVGITSVGASVLLGLIASSLGFGFVVDRMLGQHAPMYYSESEREQKMWQQPGEGRLVGRAHLDKSVEQVQITFVDSVGKNWTMDIQELRPEDRQLLQFERHVRVLGKQLDDSSVRFHACGVFPWMLDKKRPLKELSAERKESVEKMYRYSPKDRLLQLEQLAFFDMQSENIPNTKICAEIAAVKRFSN